MPSQDKLFGSFHTQAGDQEFENHIKSTLFQDFPPKPVTPREISRDLNKILMIRKLSKPRDRRNFNIISNIPFQWNFGGLGTFLPCGKCPKY